jgi:proteasome lid subunit RPN8/RPN11
MNSKKNTLKIIELQNSPKLILGKQLMSYVNFLHNKIPGKEWSGILFYTVEGSIRDINNMIFKANHFMLKDIGTSAHTGYEFDETILDYYEQYPETEDMKLALLHTHYSMKNFFSGEDLDELRDNSPKHNYYLSLVVSHDCDYSAKLAMYSRGSETKAFIKDDNGDEVEITFNEEAVLYTCDCQVEIEIDDYELDQYNRIKEECKPKATVVKGFGGYSGYNGYNNYDAYDDYQAGNLYPKTLPKTKTDLTLFTLTDETTIAFLTSLLTGKINKDYTLDDLIAIFQGIEILDSDTQDAFILSLEESLDNCLMNFYGTIEITLVTEVFTKCNEILSAYPEIMEFEVSDKLKDYFEEALEVAN